MLIISQESDCNFHHSYSFINRCKDFLLATYGVEFTASLFVQNWMYIVVDNLVQKSDANFHYSYSFINGCKDFLIVTYGVEFTTSLFVHNWMHIVVDNLVQKSDFNFHYSYSFINGCKDFLIATYGVELTASSLLVHKWMYIAWSAEGLEINVNDKKFLQSKKAQ